jgi:hypothetical protein
MELPTAVAEGQSLSLAAAHPAPELPVGQRPPLVSSSHPAGPIGRNLLEEAAP